MKKLILCLLGFLSSACYGAIGTGIGGAYVINQQGLQTGASFYVLHGSATTMGLKTLQFSDGTSMVTASVGSGGSSSVQTKVNGVQISSPTKSLSFDSNFTGNESPTGTSNISLNPGTTLYIHTGSSLQSGSTFYVSSGTVNGPMTIFNNNLQALFMPSASETLSLVNVSSHQVYVLFKSSGTNWWRMGDDVTNAGSPEFDVYNATTGVKDIAISTNDVMTLGANVIVSPLTASQPVKTNANKQLTSGLINVTTDITGTIPSGNLPANVDYINSGQTISAPKVFSASQTFTAPTTFSSTMTLSGGIPVSTAPPTSTDILQYNGSAWAPATVIPDAARLGSTQTFTGGNTFLSSVTVNGPLLANSSVGTSGQVLQSNGSGTAPSWVTSSGGGGSITSASTVTWTGVHTFNNPTTNISSSSYFPNGNVLLSSGIFSVVTTAATGGSVTVDSVASSTSAETASSISWHHTIGSNANRFIMVGIGWRNSLGQPAGISVCGQTPVSISSQPTGSMGLVVYTATAPASGDCLISSTFSANVSGIGGVSVSYYNVSQSSPTGSQSGIADNSATLTSVTSTVTVGSSDLAADFFVRQDTVQAVNLYSGQTLQTKIVFPVPNTSLGNGGPLLSSTKSGSGQMFLGETWASGARVSQVVFPITAAGSTSASTTTTPVLIANSNTLVSGTTFYVSSGTVAGQLSVTGPFFMQQANNSVGLTPNILVSTFTTNAAIVGQSDVVQHAVIPFKSSIGSYIFSASTLPYFGNETSGAVLKLQPNDGNGTAVSKFSFTGDKVGLFSADPTQGFLFTSTPTVQNALPLRLAAPSGNYIGLKSSATVASSLDFVLPAADGTSGQAMVTDGNKNLSFATISGGGGGSSVLFVATGEASGFTGTISTPTAGIVFSSDTFNGQLTAGSTAFITLNNSSVTLQGQSVLSLSSAAATYFFAASSTTLLTTSSATATYLQQLNAANTYLTQSSATATYLQKNSPVTISTNAVTANYTVTSTDSFVTADATGGSLTVTLPTAAGISGRIYRVKRMNSGVNTVTVGTTISQTIDGSTTQVLNVQYTDLEVISDGVNWEIL